MRKAGAVARRRDDVRRRCFENAVENFIRRDSERDEQAHPVAFAVNGAGGSVQLRHNVADRLFGQVGHVPLGKVASQPSGGVHELKVAMGGAGGIGCFPTAELSNPSGTDSQRSVTPRA
jgi:hypothetical protein